MNDHNQRMENNQWTEFVLRNSNDNDSGNNPYIPISNWARDHWSVLLYLKSCDLNKGGIVDNRRMRVNPRLHRKFTTSTQMVIPGGPSDTKLRDGSVAANHDDWSCLEDMVKAGVLRAYFRVKSKSSAFNCLEARVSLTERGWSIVQSLERFKSRHGSYEEFTYECG